jgi:2-haloacid dehalogenase
MRMTTVIDTIIFDLGGVLIDWDPRYLYRKIFDDETEMDHFLEHVCSGAWNEEQDAGRTLREGTEWLVARFPQYENYIRAYYGRWPEMLGGVHTGTIGILKALKDSGQYKVYALTNWSAETFPVALERYDFLGWFDGIVVSGEEKSRKPFPEFYRRLTDRYGINMQNALFIDDNLRNVQAAKACGMEAIQFQSPEALEKELRVLGIALPE